MCKLTQITFCPLAHGYHKENSVKNYHWLLNKTKDNARQYHVSHNAFIQNMNTHQYVRNSSPIDDTNVMDIVAAVGREIIFPIYAKLLPTPTLNPDKKTSVV